VTERKSMTDEWITPRPSPIPSALTQAFWEEASQGHLAIQRCQTCHFFHHPPTTLCTQCGSSQLEYEEVAPTGTIYSHSVTWDARTPAFAERQPYALVWVEMDAQDGLILIGNLPGVPFTELQIGARVDVWFERITDAYTAPQFRLNSTGPEASERSSEP
jgi:uncharacterized protein